MASIADTRDDGKVWIEFNFEVSLVICWLLPAKMVILREQGRIYRQNITNKFDISPLESELAGTSERARDLEIEVKKKGVAWLIPMTDPCMVYMVCHLPSIYPKC